MASTEYLALDDEDVEEDDQLTDFSQKYSEVSVEENDEFVVNTQKLVEDTLKSYCTEGTPRYALSVATSLTDLSNLDDSNYQSRKLNDNDDNDDIDDNDDNDFIDANRVMKPIPPVKPANLSNRIMLAPDTKTVTFGGEDNIIETPLMFSRSSSVESLSSEMDIKLNLADDAGSVVSEFR